MTRERYSKENPDPFLQNTACPACQQRVNAATNIKNKKIGQALPAPGDFTLCMFCGSILQYDAGDEGLILRAPTTQAALPNELLNLYYAWHKLYPEGRK